MLLHPAFIYVHFPKSAGSTVRGILKDFFAFELSRTNTHRPVSVLDDLLVGRQVIGSIREPYRWYESRLNYPHFRKRPLPFRDAPGLDYIEQSRFIQGMADPAFLNDHAAVLWRRPDMSIRPFEIMKRKRIGFLTFEFLYTYCRDLSLLDNDSPTLDIDFSTDLVPQYWIATERLNDTMLTMVKSSGLLAQSGLSEHAFGAALAEFRQVNVRPAAARKELSASERQIIAELDKPVFAFYDSVMATTKQAQKES